ncbi:hypothetical protein [Micromonospora purpureochromogenes]|uniref:Uncharacterized protein n=1 Tax=Micromonospora purpureochromogenes TaxID=47872 RepID=A0ABX2RR34_9ACTN|nr:hypothetical protein [Micromonospora purpureochromogenes]NYF58510.1 hypothetical protein [Micromonospora purpureochromogenes]
MTAILNPTGPAPLSPPQRRAPEPAAAPRSPVPVGPVLELPGTPAAALVPVTRDGRAVGAFVLTGGRVRYRALPDPEQVLAAVAGVAAIGLVTAAVAVASRRRPPAIGAVTMGPGGWVSLRGTRLPALRPARPRPWWARVLRAHRLVVDP